LTEDIKELALTLKDNDSDKNERNTWKSPRTNGTFAKPHKPTQTQVLQKSHFLPTRDQHN
jgi:hypothetical protein